MTGMGFTLRELLTAELGMKRGDCWWSVL